MFYPMKPVALFGIILYQISQSFLKKMVITVLGITFALNSFAQTDSTLMNDKEVILTGKTCGALPSLKYGPGTDRLGGAKMTYLDTAIVLQVVDSLKDDYIVRLSANHKAF